MLYLLLVLGIHQNPGIVLFLKGRWAYVLVLIHDARAN